MKFLSVCMYFPPEIAGGVAITTAAFAKAAVKAGHEVVVAARSSGNELKFEEQNGVRIMRVPRSAAPFEAASRLQQLARDVQPDFINQHLSTGFHQAWVVEVARETGAKIVHFLHFYQLLCRLGTLRKGEKNCVNLCAECQQFCEENRRYTMLASGVCAVSQHTLDRHLRAKLFDGVPSLVAPPIMDAVDPPPPRGDRSEIVFGFIGRLDESKGIFPLLRAAKSHDLRLLVAGSASKQLMPRMRGEFESARIQFLGWQEPKDFFSKIDVAVVPSLFEEPFGRVAVEAQACGVPVVVSRVGGLISTYSEGVTGWGYDPGERDGLERLLARVSMEKPFSADACREFAANFRSDRIWPSYEAFFADLLAKPPNAQIKPIPARRS